MERNQKKTHIMESGLSCLSNSKVKSREKIHIQDVEDYLEDMKGNT